MRASPAKMPHIPQDIGAGQRVALLGQKPMVLWVTGLSGSGKSTLCCGVESALHRRGFKTYLIDGDDLRRGLCHDLGFDAHDRAENVRRASEVARMMADAGLIVLVSMISPFQHDREQARRRIGAERFFEIYMATPLEVCQSRDPKGLYKSAAQGKIRTFTGISSPYEVPPSPDCVIDTSNTTVRSCVDAVLQRLSVGSN